MVSGMDASDDRPNGTDAIGRDRVAYTVKETARLLSLSEAKVYMMIASGELTSFKVGRARRVHGTAIEEYARHAIERAAS